MTAKILLLVVISVAFVSNQSIEPDLKKTQYFFKDGLFRLKLGVRGGFPPYTFNFINVPESWLTLSDFIFVPSQSIRTVKKHVIRVQVSDSLGQKVSFSTIAATTGQIVEIYHEYYPIDYAFSNESLSMEKTSLAGQSSIQNQLLQRQRLQTQLNTKIDQSLLELPSLSDFDLLLQAFNHTKFLQILSTVRGVEMDCIGKVSYLQEMLGRINSAIEGKKLQISKVQLFNEEVSLKIQKIQDEIAQLQLQKFKLNDMESNLHQKQQQLNKKSIQINILQANIQAIQFQIINLTFKEFAIQKQLLILRNRVDGIKAITLSKDGTQLAIITQQLILIVQRLSQLELEAGVVQIQKQIRAQEMEKLQSSLQNQNLAKITISSEVLDLSQSLKNNQLKVQTINLNILIIEGQITQLKGNLKTQEFKKIEKDIHSLTSIAVQVEKQMDSSYYECYRVNDPSLKVSSTISIQLTSIQFLTYTLEAYGVSTPLNHSIISIEIINVFNPVWIGKYGAVFNQKIIFMSKSYRFINDFTCLQPSLLKRISGKIISIEQNIIKIQKQGGIELILVGSCTRVEYVENLPTIGTIIYVQGINQLPNIYQAYNILSI